MSDVGSTHLAKMVWSMSHFNGGGGGGCSMLLWAIIMWNEAVNLLYFGNGTYSAHHVGTI